MAFNQGISGLNAAAANLDVIGNNIANSGTVGFKTGTALFSDVYAGARIGLGTTVAGITQNFTQGSVQTSASSLDVAIVDGSGFFRMTSPSGEVAYSRNGQFNKDNNGYIVNSAGFRLTGYQVGANGTLAGGMPAALQLPTAEMTPNATTAITAQFNLDSRSTVPAATPFDPNNSQTYSYSNAVSAYDSLGNPHELGAFFVKTGVNSWDVYNTVDGSPVSGSAAAIATATATKTATAAALAAATGAAIPPAQAADDAAAADLAAITTGGKIGSVAFDNAGALTSASTLTPGSFTLSNGAAPLSYTLDVLGTTQFGNANDVKKLTQDGYTSGQLIGFQIGDDGTVTGNYSNEQTKTLGQVVLSSFANPNGLLSQGANMWSETGASGQPLTGTPGKGTKLGSLLAGAQESSNVDLTSELVNLIVAQRTYQANAQTVKTQDQVVQALINMR
jgi:flagellar hook protein FlgE